MALAGGLGVDVAVVMHAARDTEVWVSLLRWRARYRACRVACVRRPRRLVSYRRCATRWFSRRAGAEQLRPQ